MTYSDHVQLFSKSKLNTQLDTHPQQSWSGSLVAPLAFPIVLARLLYLVELWD